MNEQPTPPDENSATHLQALTIARDNALRELNLVAGKLLAPTLAVAQVQMQIGQNIVVAANPANYAEALGTLMMQVKQIEIAVNTLVEILFAVGEKPPVTAAEYIKRQTASVKATAKMMQRGLLSQGADRPGPRILKPS
jgi:hypothetical protein